MREFRLLMVGMILVAGYTDDLIFGTLATFGMVILVIQDMMKLDDEKRARQRMLALREEEIRALHEHRVLAQCARCRTYAVRQDDY